jgi:hypothetical protein
MHDLVSVIHVPTIIKLEYCQTRVLFVKITERLLQNNAYQNILQHETYHE